MGNPLMVQVVVVISALLISHGGSDPIVIMIGARSGYILCIQYTFPFPLIRRRLPRIITCATGEAALVHASVLVRSLSRIYLVTVGTVYPFSQSCLPSPEPFPTDSATLQSSFQPYETVRVQNAHLAWGASEHSSLSIDVFLEHTQLRLLLLKYVSNIYAKEFNHSDGKFNHSSKVS